MTINFENLSIINSKLKIYPSAKLLIVTKNRALSEIKILIDQGYRLFGENKVQEAQFKFSDNFIRENKIELHMIGPLQTNKVKNALNIFNTIQSIDRPNLAEKISNELIKNSRALTKNFYIQVNIGNETQKSGVSEVELKNFYDYCLSLNLNIVGLMCIPPNQKNPSEHFIKMNELKNNLNKNLLLSMGMSNDYLYALQHGSNLVRIGSIIFD